MEITELNMIEDGGEALKTIHFETVSRYTRSLEPATVGIPFAQGELKLEDISRGRVTDGKKCFPIQSHPGACWPDGSVKWLLVNFLADLPQQQKKHVSLSVDIINN